MPNKIPVSTIINKLDSCLNKEDYQGAQVLLNYWVNEARALGDRSGELSLLNELMGFSRRINDKEGGLSAVWRGFELVEDLRLKGKTAGTIYLNGATTLKAFGCFADSVAHYEKAERCFEGCVPKEDPIWAGLYNNRALAYADVGRLDDALDSYQLAMDVLKQRADDVSRLDLAVTLMNLSELFESMNEGAELINDFLCQAKDVLEASDLVKNGHYAFVCRKCAPTFTHFGWADYGMELDERASLIYEGN